MSFGHSTKVAEAMALSDLAFRKRYRSSYETPSPSLTFSIRKRYIGTSELILDTGGEEDELGDEDTDQDGEVESLGMDDERERERERERSDDKDQGLDDEGCSLEGEGLGLEEEEEVVPKGQQQAVLVVDTTVSEPLRLGYGALIHRELAVGEDQPTLTTWVDPRDDRVYIDIMIYPPVAPVQTQPSLEWSSGSLPISPSSTIVPSPIATPVATLTAIISVDEDQFLEAGQTDAYRAALRHAIYDTQRENHDLRTHLAEESRERLELVDHVSRMERRQNYIEE
nr:hypothetical protein [Tanacetum cinerariifolium]